MWDGGICVLAALGLRFRAASKRDFATAFTEASAAASADNVLGALAGTVGCTRTGGLKTPRVRNSSSSFSSCPRRSVRSTSFSPKDCGVRLDKGARRVPRIASTLADTEFTFSSRAWPIGPDEVIAAETPFSRASRTDSGRAALVTQCAPAGGP